MHFFWQSRAYFIGRIVFISKRNDFSKKIANSASKQREHSLEEFNKRNIYDDDDDDEILV